MLWIHRSGLEADFGSTQHGIGSGALQRKEDIVKNEAPDTDDSVQGISCSTLNHFQWHEVQWICFFNQTSIVFFYDSTMHNIVGREYFHLIIVE